jgi:hypothetical protein
MTLPGRKVREELAGPTAMTNDKWSSMEIIMLEVIYAGRAVHAKHQFVETSLVFIIR